jgi:hypothetical protein
MCREPSTWSNGQQPARPHQRQPPSTGGNAARHTGAVWLPGSCPTLQRLALAMRSSSSFFLIAKEFELPLAALMTSSACYNKVSKIVALQLCLRHDGNKQEKNGHEMKMRIDLQGVGQHQALSDGLNIAESSGTGTLGDQVQSLSSRDLDFARC